MNAWAVQYAHSRSAIWLIMASALPITDIETINDVWGINIKFVWIVANIRDFDWWPSFLWCLSLLFCRVAIVPVLRGQQWSLTLVKLLNQKSSPPKCVCFWHHLHMPVTTCICLLNSRNHLLLCDETCIHIYKTLMCSSLSLRPFTKSFLF